MPRGRRHSTAANQLSDPAKGQLGLPRADALCLNSLGSRQLVYKPGSGRLHDTSQPHIPNPALLQSDYHDWLKSTESSHSPNCNVMAPCIHSNNNDSSLLWEEDRLMYTKNNFSRHKQ
ncbi:hypothetical protein J6590_006107 [Homalodisca vitripennis]|nr:hypothetical protein J6590_006107 [Homalodisca vitripennis]